MLNDNRIRIPAVGAKSVEIRFSPVPRTGDFNPEAWQHIPLARSPESILGEWWEVNLENLNLEDGSYEYEFRVTSDNGDSVIVADPYAEELTRYGGYRGIFHIRTGRRHRIPFSWQNEIPSGMKLPENNELIIYELPMRWVDSPPEGQERQVGLGTFDKALFEHLEYFKDLGINAIEILPVQDSSDTLNWGYGTRFFFAPDIDMGGPSDLKLFIKECHRRGIRVILDIVMNHSRKCPLETLAFGMFYLENGEQEKDEQGNSRNGWGGQLFRYRDMRYDSYHARNFHFDMSEFWIKEYHVDGFRIDEFKGIGNWDFIRDFRNHSWEIQRTTFPSRPFIVIAEDSWRRPEVTQDIGNGKTADAIWDFDSRDELRRLVGDRLSTRWGEPSRSERVQAMIKGNRCWDNKDRKWRQSFQNGLWVEIGFTDMAQRIVYNTSHDVEDPNEQRILPYAVDKIKAEWQLWDSLQSDKNIDIDSLSQALRGIHDAFEQVFATFAFIMTSPGIPMFLSGEEFGDLHDLDPKNWKLKMTDPVDFRRVESSGHKDLFARVKQLILLRSRHEALHRNEVVFFGLENGFHPTFDENEGVRVFGYCRNGGQPLGHPGQVIVIANCGKHDFPLFGIEWPWGGMMVNEVGGIRQPLPSISGNRADLALRPYQVRVFAT
jgi:1,4-alpha-glucan branching enzyme